MKYEEYRAYKNLDLSSGRVYDVPDGKFPSVTTVLSQTANKPALEAWKNRVGPEEVARTLKRASERGTILHDTLEHFLQEYPCPSISDARDFVGRENFVALEPSLQAQIKKIMKKLIANNFRALGLEFVVWDAELGYAGRLDAIGYWGETLVIVDFKSSAKKKKREYVQDYYLQATAYCNAHNKLFDEQVNQFVILVSSEEDTMQPYMGHYLNFLPEFKNRVRQYYEQRNK